MLYVCAGASSDIASIDDLRRRSGFVTLVSEYPNLAENFSITNRLGRFKIFSA